MKLIIDIEESYYEIIKYDVAHSHYKPFKIIANGMPYEERPQGEHIIKCPDCRFYHKIWHSDKRMKEKGYWCCWCDCHDDWVGGTNGFCSLAERQGEEE